MFDNKDIEAYRKISAPDELRLRIAQSCQAEIAAPRFSAAKIRGLSAVAACLIIIACVFTFGRNDGISITVNGEELSSQEIILADVNQGIAPAAARMLPVYNVPVKLDVKRQTEISVSDGMMQIFDAETGEYIASETSISTDRDIQISWELSETSAEPKMYVRDKKNSYTITLRYDEAANQRTICRQKN